MDVGACRITSVRTASGRIEGRHTPTGLLGAKRDPPVSLQKKTMIKRMKLVGMQIVEQIEVRWRLEMRESTVVCSCSNPWLVDL
jgi:hypothetical protein